MTNLPSTLQRVLAEFDERVLVLMCSTCAADVVFSAKNIPELKTFIESALTESLKEAFAVAESDVDIKAVIRWNIDRAEDIIDDARDELFDPKERAMTGGIRSVAGGIKESLEHILAALQAIEEKRKTYMAEK